MADNALSGIWPEWTLEKTIGRGFYGEVYQAVRRDHNVESYAAIKVISIPSDAAEIDSLRFEGLDMGSTRAYLEDVKNEFVREIQLMESLKGIQNIVSIEDYKVVEAMGGIGWDIYIRMELLTPFYQYISDKRLTEKEVVKLGLGICTALDICSRRNIIHRDIKPENIFVNDFGHFKLGDFGIARKLEHLTHGLSRKGTFHYMAPEVANGADYDARADIYSLGIVLYRLLNNNRLPFLDPQKPILTPEDRRSATERRNSGQPFPPPCDASPEMAEVILRACAFDPARRFADPAEMKRALATIQAGGHQAAGGSPAPRPIPAPPAPAEPVQKPRAAVTAPPPPPQPRRKKEGLVILFAALATVAILAAFWIIGTFVFSSHSKTDNKAASDSLEQRGSREKDQREEDQEEDQEKDQEEDQEKGQEEDQEETDSGFPQAVYDDILNRRELIQLEGASVPSRATRIPLNEAVFSEIEDGARGAWYKFQTTQKKGSYYFVTTCWSIGSPSATMEIIKAADNRAVTLWIATTEDGQEFCHTVDSLEPNTTYYLHVTQTGRASDGAGAGAETADNGTDFLLVLLSPQPDTEN